MNLLKKLFPAKENQPSLQMLGEPCCQPGGEAIITALSRSGQYAVSASASGHFMVWDAATGAAREDQQVAGVDVNCAAIDSEGRRAILGGTNAKFQGVIVIADFHKRSIEHVIFHDRPVQAVDFSPDGQWIASGGWDWVARVADPVTLDTYFGGRHPDFVNAVKFSLDGKELISVSWDWTLKVWDIRSGALLRSFECEPDHYDIRLSPDGGWLAVKIGATCHLVDTMTGMTLATWEMAGKLLGVVQHKAHGVLVWEGLADGAQAYSPQQKSTLFRLPPKTAPVVSLDCTAGGQRMVAAGGAGELSFWSLA